MKIIKFRKNRKARIFFVCCFIFGILNFAGILIYQERLIASKQEELIELQKKETDLINQNEQLKMQCAIADTDEYVEKVAREKLGMVKPGEKIFFDANK